MPNNRLHADRLYRAALSKFFAHCNFLTFKYFLGSRRRQVKRDVMCKMSQIFQKLKNWYRGEHIPYTLQEMMDLQLDMFDEPRTKHLPERFQTPLLVRIINFICRFWLSRWPVLLTVIVGILGIIVMLFIHFDTKSSSEPQQKHDKAPRETGLIKQ